MNPVARILIGGSAISGIVGGSMFLNKYLSNEDIESKLKANKYELLGQEEANNSVWEGILASYKIVATKNSKYKFDDFLGTETDASNPPKALSTLKQKCKEVLKKKLSEDEDSESYEKAKRWCTTPISISKLSEKEGYVALKDDVLDTKTDKDAWIQKIKDHKDPKNKDTIISDLVLSTEKDSSKIEENIKLIKNKCKTIGESKNHSDDWEGSLKKFKIWCSNKKDKE
ncbi:hypothetical protein A6V39_03605 [Candidatus Mycoplasma haematobovis]|uniref:Uncharacterized protein n=1 Tax=Candidatus Mycoplasma haematobovis TaxID=432608 RepID=A0A1A9QBL1_9MOLU|nr:hypothetical protein [Candidatus Mycoplasma haematobovis]OAL09972.1 hypothetical protein A6V39_03605 [Candidatus Mycoplasma haematobovis]